MAFRQALNRLPRALNAAKQQVRLHGDINDPAHQAQVELWTKISYGMVGLSGALAVYVLGQVLTEEHHAHDDKPKPPYMHIRSKPFPFEISECALFDLDCKAKARAAAKATGH